MKPAEYVSSDILEENHLKAFAPFRFIQMILGSCRVDAKDRFVTSPTKAQKLYTLIILLIVMLLYISVTFNYLSQLLPHYNLYYLSLITFFIHYGTYAANIIHVRFVNNEHNVKMYIKMQDIDRKLKIDQNKHLNNLLFKSNLITVVISVILFFVLFSITINQNVIISVSFLGPLVSQLTSTLEWLYCANLLIYLYLRIRYINAIMVNYIEGTEDINVENVRKKTIPTMEVLRYLASNAHDLKSSDADVFLKNIFEELFRFQYLYRFQVLLFCFKFVTCTLLSFEIALQGIHYNVLEWFVYIVLTAITIIDVIIILVISIRCEVFFKEVKNTKYLCIKILSLIYSGQLRQKVIRMLKMIKEKPPQFTVYDMWCMDAATMISMINLVTTLMVTLLQFALL